MKSVMNEYLSILTLYKRLQILGPELPIHFNKCAININNKNPKASTMPSCVV